jgi:predicted ATPase
MKIKLEKVGIIKHAEIEFPGITVIAGENDTGKSTIGKMIYSTIIAFSKTEFDMRNNKIDNLFDLINRISNRIDDVAFEKKKAEYTHNFTSNIDNKEKLLVVFNEYKAYCLQASQKQEAASINLITKYLNNLEDVLHNEKNLQEYITTFLRGMLSSEFYGQVNNSVDEKISEISWEENNTELFKFSVQENSLVAINIERAKMFFNKALLLESPLLLQMKSLINKAATTVEINNAIEKDTLSSLIFGRGVVPFHIKELCDTLNMGQYMSKEADALSEQINDIIHGRFIFDENINEFVFAKHGGSALRTINTANGVKAFGILDILLHSKMVNDTSLLILDEPEVNMHPEWQLKYAELLIELCNQGIHVLITSHSPYMIQALKYFSQKAGIFGEKTRFYLAERVRNGENWAEIRDVGTDINPIFDKLTKPFDNLINDELEQ